MSQDSIESYVRRAVAGVRQRLVEACARVGRDPSELTLVGVSKRQDPARIAAAVRELGLHHPRSSASKFVTVRFDVSVADAANESRGASEFLDESLGAVAE